MLLAKDTLTRDKNFQILYHFTAHHIGGYSLDPFLGGNFLKCGAHPGFEL